MMIYVHMQPIVKPGSVEDLNGAAG
jgi:hypothetical protein